MGGVSDRSVNPEAAGGAGGAASADPAAEALSLLTRAQALADDLRLEAHREVVSARDEATRLRAEAQEAGHELDDLRAGIAASRGDQGQR